MLACYLGCIEDEKTENMARMHWNCEQIENDCEPVDILIDIDI